MPYSDYRCQECNEITEFYKSSVEESFPVTIKCSKCGKIAKRIYSGKLVTDVCEGILGNASTGYRKGITYHPGKIVGRMKGKRIK